jgi:group I intron endonuclease
MKNRCIIYIITNTYNDKAYIGQTWNSLSKRFNEHKKGVHNKKLINAMNKYGRENFSIKELDCAYNQKDADRLEILYILQYNSINNGYNIREGGSHGKHSNETKQKIALSHIGKTHSIDTIQKMSKSQKGRTFSDITLEKMSQVKRGELHPRAKLTWNIVASIRNDYSLNLGTYRDLAVKYNTNYGTVGKIINNLIWIK